MYLQILLAMLSLKATVCPVFTESAVAHSHAGTAAAHSGESHSNYSTGEPLNLLGLLHAWVKTLTKVLTDQVPQCPGTAQAGPAATAMHIWHYGNTTFSISCCTEHITFSGLTFVMHMEPGAQGLTRHCILDSCPKEGVKPPYGLEDLEAAV